MHYHLELIIPPTGYVDDTVKDAMSAFAEEIYDPDYGEWRDNPQGFYDWYVIGGRWTGAKAEALISEDEIDLFTDHLMNIGITVSGLQAGKPTLQPVDQAETVDALWCQWFPQWPGTQCPLFDHYNEGSDIWPLDAVPPGLTAAKVLIYNGDYPVFMLDTEIWNGVTHQPTAWDGNVLDAAQQWREALSTRSYNEDFKRKSTPGSDWLAVTIDFHR